MIAKEPEIKGIDGTVRKAHYGEGRQPWDDIKDAGWAPDFAAGNALKYVRRHEAKNGQDDLDKGRWYFAELIKMSDGPLESMEANRAWLVLRQLRARLTTSELALLENKS